MALNDLAAGLLLFMPFSFLAKTLAVAFSAGMLAGQVSVHDYGRYTVRFFVSLFATSLLLTLLFTALAWRFHDSGDLAVWLWLLVPIEAASWATAWYGWRMVDAEKSLP